MAIGSTSNCQLLGAIEQLAKRPQPLWPLHDGPQALSSVVQLAIRGNAGKVTVHVAAV